MATLSITTTSRAGIGLAAADVPADVAGDKWLNTGAELLYVDNQSVGSITLTFPVVATVDGQAVAARTVAVGAGLKFLIGPFPAGTYNDANGFCNVTYSGVTTLFVAPIKPGT